MLAVATLLWSFIDARESMRLGEEALATLSDVDDSMLRDTTHGHFALACAAAGQWERCIEHMELAGAPGFERFGEPGRKCLWSEALVRSALGLDRLDQARIWATRGEEFAAGLRLPIAAAATMRGRALVLLAEGDAASRRRAGGSRPPTPRREPEGGWRPPGPRSSPARPSAAAGERTAAVQRLRAVRAEMAQLGRPTA